jgi:hypothetical protein
MATPEFLVLLFLIIIALCCMSILKLARRFESTIDSKRALPSGLDRTSRYLIIIAGCLVLISIASPAIFTSARWKDTFSQSTGNAGDTIGGLMNPFITMAGVIVTGLAFFMQYRANEQQKVFFIKGQAESKKQFTQQINIQKFESQFYEMLKLHRDNINEMKISGYDFEENPLKRYEKITEGRKVFITMQTELECILSIYRFISGPLDSEGFKKCYALFFFGLEKFQIDFPEEKLFIRNLKNARTQHRSPTASVATNQNRKKFTIPLEKGNVSINLVDLAFNYKPFSGHSSRLGHYFRHLYITVKLIVYNEIGMSYNEKMKYLKMLRAQLSNHEQILMFYNWLGEFGIDWENNENKFFTEYKMIHNLWHVNLFKDQFIRNKIIELATLPVVFRQGNMFEIEITISPKF